MIGAVDIGGTKIAVGIVDARGQVLARAECPTDSRRGFPAGIARIAGLVRETAARAKADVHGIGIGCTGPVDPVLGILGSVDLLPGWQGGAIVRELSNIFGVPVAMENDADAAALAEAAWGTGRGKARFVYVTIGTGIGVAVILDGALYRGAGGAHPETGHIVIDPAGPPCYCGAHGCWEVLASGPALAARADALRSGLTVPELCALAESGDPGALAAIERQGYYLGLGLANLVSTFCPDTIALGGGVMRAGHLLLDRARAVIRQCCTMVPFERTELVPAMLGEDAALAGAACVWRHRFGGEGKSNAV